jgi:hypothetical protein
MHLTDDQLNEYLDHELADRAEAERHLAECADCAARLAALQALFGEIESLPELPLSHSIAARFKRTLRQAQGGDSNPPAPLPHSLRLTVALQAALAVVAIIIAAPFVMQFISPYLSGLQVPPTTDIFILLQAQWTTWLDMLSQFQLPAFPEIPAAEVSSMFITVTLAGVSVFWLVGNGLLLRNQIK